MCGKKKLQIDANYTFPILLWHLDSGQNCCNEASVVMAVKTILCHTQTHPLEVSVAAAGRLIKIYTIQ